MEQEEILKVKEEKERAETEKRKRAEDAFLKRIEEKKRLPMVKPSGKYNVHNKITRSAGTSH